MNRPFCRLACLALLLSNSSGLKAQSPPPILLAQVLGPRVDPSKYLVSEKFDGVRAIWDGTQLKFRSGRTISAPRWFLEKLPAQPLDGELWLGRGRVEELSAIVRKAEPVDGEWRQLTYLIFELPQASGSFAARVQRMHDLVASLAWPQLVAVAQEAGMDRAALQVKLRAVLAQGGEGLMLHLADAPYQTGRSEVLLKVKPVLDTEGVVIAILPGKGKFEGRMGALRVQTPEGKIFNLGTGFSDTVRTHPPTVGTTITYTYRGLTNRGLPRFASYLRVREAF